MFLSTITRFLNIIFNWIQVFLVIICVKCLQCEVNGFSGIILIKVFQTKMPKRNKHRKHGKNRKKYAREKCENNSQPADDSISPENNSDTLVNFNNSLNFQTPLRPKVKNTNSPILESPVNTIIPNSSKDDFSLNVKNDILEEYTPVKTNHYKRRVSLTKQRERRSESWNVTNLKDLFEEDLSSCSATVIHNNCELRKSNSRRRSSSSIAKLHSPGKEKPLSFHKSTQTLDEISLHQSLADNIITETPKMNHGTKDFAQIDKTLNLNNAKNNSNHALKLIHADININPYLKDTGFINVELDQNQKKINKEPSAEERSFFSPQLFNMESSSTPVDKIHSQKLYSYLKETVMKETMENVISSGGKFDFISNKIDTTPLRDSIVCDTPRSEKILNKKQNLNGSFDIQIDPIVQNKRDVNFNTPPVSEKTNYKEKTNSIRLLSNKKRSYGTSSMLYDRSSPKMSKLLKHSRMFNKNMSYSRLSASRRSSLDRSCELSRFSNNSRVGLYEKMINKIRKYSRVSARWSYRMVDICSQLGIQIKKSLTSLCKVYEKNTVQECTERVCKCEELREQISNLNTHISGLNSEIENLKQQLHENNDNKNSDIEKLNTEINKIKQELSRVTDVRSELTSLKEQFQCFKTRSIEQAATSAPSSVVNSAPPPPPPPLPPPPPPPPPPLLMVQKPQKLGLGKRAKTTLGIPSVEKSDSRPVISLDDILKVKLKKASERPTVNPTTRNRTSTPVVSMDMLRQVKLRPSSRPSMVKSTPNRSSLSTPGGSTGSSDTPTSPHSSLCRLLNGDSGEIAVDRYGEEREDR
ncbi:cyclin-dependent kinase 12-like isoform X2 [Sitophilus oryzae]|uniref:Cyclin-dependent kinase 12-like isoform X2 n=1 Tax=Sitophilus oryzae TaxID=7048 RepID=A0A6J2XU02_SITOR|nr:cyclin-dependent kinase 12-like isoform X2 [Sitophilus oryzae]